MHRIDERPSPTVYTENCLQYLVINLMKKNIYVCVMNFFAV